MAPPDARPVPQANNVPPGAGKVLSTILIFTILMIVVPLGLYFASWEGYFDREWREGRAIPQRQQAAAFPWAIVSLAAA